MATASQLARFRFRISPGDSPRFLSVSAYNDRRGRLPKQQHRFYAIALPDHPASTCAIQHIVDEYLPTLRLAFSGGVFNEYRLTENQQIEFRISDGQWRALDIGEVELHYVLHTEVSKWLARVLANAERTGEAPR